MSGLINLPPNDEDESAGDLKPSARKIFLQAAIGFLVAVTFVFSLAGTINIGGGEAFELGQRSYDVGTCATGTVQIIPKVTLVGAQSNFSQFTVTGISPVTCAGRVIRILPFDIAGVGIAIVDGPDSGDNPDQSYIDIFVSGGEFLASSGGSVSSVTDSTLSRSTGQSSIRRSTFTPGATTIEVLSGGQGRTLKSSEDALAGLAISFQVRWSPIIEITGYGRTDVELRFPPAI